MDFLNPFHRGDEAVDSSDANSPCFHPFERERLASLREYLPFPRPGDELMMTLACEATEVCSASVGMVSLMEEFEERVLACVGAEIENVERARSLCAYSILEPDVMVVEDARNDPRFRDKPFVTGPPFLRFYAGAPIFDASGLPLGSVCASDSKPHDISSKCLLALRHLASVASAVLETRKLYAKPRGDLVAGHSRLDAHLLTMIEPRPVCS